MPPRRGAAGPGRGGRTGGQARPRAPSKTSQELEARALLSQRAADAERAAAAHRDPVDDHMMGMIDERSVVDADSDDDDDDDGVTASSVAADASVPMRYAPAPAVFGRSAAGSGYVDVPAKDFGIPMDINMRIPARAAAAGASRGEEPAPRRGRSPSATADMTYAPHYEPYAAAGGGGGGGGVGYVEYSDDYDDHAEDSSPGSGQDVSSAGGGSRYFRGMRVEGGALGGGVGGVGGGTPSKRFRRDRYGIGIGDASFNIFDVRGGSGGGGGAAAAAGGGGGGGGAANLDKLKESRSKKDAAIDKLREEVLELQQEEAMVGADDRSIYEAIERKRAEIDRLRAERDALYSDAEAEKFSKAGQDGLLMQREDGVYERPGERMRFNSEPDRPYSAQWLETQFSRLDRLNSHPDYKFLRMVAGYRNQSVIELLQADDLARRIRLENYRLKVEQALKFSQSLADPAKWNADLKEDRAETVRKIRQVTRIITQSTAVMSTYIRPPASSQFNDLTSSYYVLDRRVEAAFKIANSGQGGAAQLSPEETFRATFTEHTGLIYNSNLTPYLDAVVAANDIKKAGQQQQTSVIIGNGKELGNVRDNGTLELTGATFADLDVGPQLPGGDAGDNFRRSMAAVLLDYVFNGSKIAPPGDTRNTFLNNAMPDHVPKMANLAATPNRSGQREEVAKFFTRYRANDPVIAPQSAGAAAAAAAGGGGGGGGVQQAPPANDDDLTPEQKRALRSITYEDIVGKTINTEVVVSPGISTELQLLFPRPVSPNIKLAPYRRFLFGIAGDPADPFIKLWYHIVDQATRKVVALQDRLQQIERKWREREDERERLISGNVGEIPGLPYEHSLEWATRPENSGRVQVQPRVQSALALAYQRFRRYVPNLFDTYPYAARSHWAARQAPAGAPEDPWPTILQYDTVLQTYFARAVALAMGNQSFDNPRQYMLSRMPEVYNDQTAGVLRSIRQELLHRRIQYDEFQGKFVNVSTAW